MIQKIQGIYYCLTGIWPVIHISSFMAVTGPKTDLWLVKMVGLLSLAIGLSLLFGEKRHDTRILSIASILAFMAIDIYYSLSQIISNIYLLDAGLQFGILLGILFQEFGRGVNRDHH